MKKIAYFLSAFILATMVISCDKKDDESDTDTVWFTTTYRNIASTCNTTNLNFSFLVTRVSDGLQESYTVAPGTFEIGSYMGYDDGETINIQVFAASSEDPLHEANIPFIFANYTEAQLASLNNELNISYCHEDDIGNITWVFDI